MRIFLSVSAVIISLMVTIAQQAVFAGGTTTMTGDASLSAPTVNFDPAFQNGDTIVVPNAVATLRMDATTPSNIQALRLNLPTGGILGQVLLINNPGNTNTIGSIAGTGELRSVLINASYILTLSGTAGDGNNPVANDYSGLSPASLVMLGDSVLNINAPTTISYSANSFSPGSMININNDVIFTNLAASGAQTINIGSTGAPQRFTFKVSADSFNILNNSTINFKDQNSVFNIVAPQTQTVTLSKDLDPGQSGYGIVGLSAGAGNTLTITDGSLGTTTNRLRDLVLSGNNSTFAVQSTLYSNSLTTSGTLNLNSDLADIATVNLDSAQVSYAGQASFSDNLTLMTTYDSEIQKGGNITVASGSTFDLSTLGAMNVILNPLNSDINAVEGVEYNVIKSEDGSGIASTANVTLDASAEGNEFIEWYVAENSSKALTLRARDISTEVN